MTCDNGRRLLLGLGLSASIAFAACAKKDQPPTRNEIASTNLGNYTGMVTQTACISNGTERRCGKPVATQYEHGRPKETPPLHIAFPHGDSIDIPYGTDIDRPDFKLYYGPARTYRIPELTVPARRGGKVGPFNARAADIDCANKINAVTAKWQHAYDVWQSVYFVHFDKQMRAIDRKNAKTQAILDAIDRR